MTDSPSLPRLDAHAARALAVLLEKEKTVPDSYPMSLNALLAGCNQRSNRDPVMNLDETELLNALETLRSLSLVIESSGGRVTRYEQNLPRVLGIPSEAAALLSVLMLRGPQTAGEQQGDAGRGEPRGPGPVGRGDHLEGGSGAAGGRTTGDGRDDGRLAHRWGPSW